MGSLIESIKLTGLKKIPHPQGDIFHALKKSDSGFAGFGEAYFSCIHKGEIKGWKKHSIMTLNLIVPVGEIKFVVWDEASNRFFETVLSQNNYQRLTVPPLLWMAFCGLGDGLNMLLNIASIEHSPEESQNRSLDRIPYDWNP